MNPALDPSTVLHDLTTGDSVRLDGLPREHGIYALHDHAGVIRYVGITLTDKKGFHGRMNKHVSGSESRSHKFSHAYNTGRMWRAKEDDHTDAKLAKKLRTIFVRRHCRATFVIVPSTSLGVLSRLEKAVQRIALRDGMLDWGGKRSFVSLDEPKELVDALLDEFCFSPDQRASVARQAVLCAASRAASF